MAEEKCIDFFQDDLKYYFDFNKDFNRISSIQKANSSEYEVYLTDIKSEFRVCAQDGCIIIKELSTQQAKIYRQISVLWNPYLETIYGVLEKEGHYISFNEFVKAPNSLCWANRSLNLEEYILHFGCFSEKDALILLWQLCEGIKALQKIHLTHGDIAPQNILLTDTCQWEVFSSPFSATSGKLSLKLIDFGISREKKDRDHEVTTVIGTKPFAAPEILDFRHPTDRIDIYSLGCILHYMVTGKSPKEIDIKLTKKHISRGLYYIIEHCTASYEKRYQNIPKLQREIIYQYRCSSNIIYMLLSYIPGLKSLHPLKHIIVFILYTLFLLLGLNILGRI